MGLDTGNGTPYSANSPYSVETSGNTNAGWVDSEPLKVDVEGLRDYAKDMVSQQLDLANRKMNLNDLFSGPYEAWGGTTLGEAMYLRSQLAANASELFSYLDNLGQSLFNVGSAAQTIADIYGAEDATQAASVNDVLFAFGAPGVSRPAGLPSHIGQTYSEAVREASAEAAETPVVANSPDWDEPQTLSETPYQTTTVSTDPNTGQKLQTVTMNVPGGGGVVQTITIYNSKGEVLSTTSTRTVTSYNPATNTEVKTVTSGNSTTRTTTAYDDDGLVANEKTQNSTTGENGKVTETGSREVTVDQNTGMQTETTYNAEGETTGTTYTGKETEGQLTVDKPLSAEYDPTLNGTLTNG
ncbi:MULTISPECIES: hypothetical protein [Actinoplanes]|uniref:hypothetical protein n=1 Tax=Actinoplanes TaxID=1865 RepID=UPI000B013360|nr:MULTISPECIES: hypothetical protein [Actinoplanes]